MLLLGESPPRRRSPQLGLTEDVGNSSTHICTEIKLYIVRTQMQHPYTTYPEMS